MNGGDQPKRVHVDLGSRAYDIEIVSDRLASCGASIEAWCAARTKDCSGVRKSLIITDCNVAVPHAERVGDSLREQQWAVETAQLEPGELTKRLDVAAQMYDRLIEIRADRQTVIVAVGGGVIGDLAGFVAATYARGIPFVQVPTTLLAQVDSSVGGKTGVNHPQGKNLIGAFHQPLGVLVDTATLNTLPDREYRSGLAEVIKYGVILDGEFFEYLEAHVTDLIDRRPDVMRHMIRRSCRLKADVVEQDEYERSGHRAVLNYGHTFAHALEALCGYGVLLHGEAVSIGMVCASRLAQAHGLVDAHVTQRQIDLVQAVGLPARLSPSAGCSVTEILDRMKLDKKTVHGQLRFVLPERIGKVNVYRDVPESLVETVLGSII